MHRHGYKGRKFGRERDQRRALLKGLATSLVMEERIETLFSDKYLGWSAAHQPYQSYLMRNRCLPRWATRLVPSSI